jgi:hypothetical protein
LCRSISAFALAVAFAAPAAVAAQIEIEVSREGDRFDVSAVARLRADAATAFATLTDYEQLPRFVPDVREVHVLRRERYVTNLSPHNEAVAHERLLLDQRGDFRIWWFSQAVEIRLEVVHVNGDEIRAALAPMPARADEEVGRLESFAGRYRIEPVAGENGSVTIRLYYDAHFVPLFHVPYLIGTSAVRRTVRGQFAAMAEEIERRFAAR